MKKSFSIPSGTRWVNYSRCHDDIGWTWDDNISSSLGIDGNDHRRFLNQFYTGQFEGSFASGVPFAENPETGDCRVCGTMAALVGFEQSTVNKDHKNTQLALARINLINSLILGLPGIPLLYQGDDLLVFNDFSYLNDSTKVEDSRWVHRKKLTQSDFNKATDQNLPQGEMLQKLTSRITQRQTLLGLSSGQIDVLEPINSHCILLRVGEANGECHWILANFSEHKIDLPRERLDIPQSESLIDLITDYSIPREIVLLPYQCMWLQLTPNHK